jgi:hypothetical protein
MVRTWNPAAFSAFTQRAACAAGFVPGGRSMGRCIENASMARPPSVTRHKAARSASVMPWRSSELRQSTMRRRRRASPAAARTDPTVYSNRRPGSAGSRPASAGVSSTITSPGKCRIATPASAAVPTAIRSTPRSAAVRVSNGTVSP